MRSSSVKDLRWALMLELDVSFWLVLTGSHMNMHKIVENDAMLDVWNMHLDGFNSANPLSQRIEQSW